MSIDSGILEMGRHRIRQILLRTDASHDGRPWFLRVTEASKHRRLSWHTVYIIILLIGLSLFFSSFSRCN